MSELKCPKCGDNNIMPAYSLHTPKTKQLEIPGFQGLAWDKPTTLFCMRKNCRWQADVKVRMQITQAEVDAIWAEEEAKAE